ncbi:MAG: hypothetical protein DHS20C15_23490 [Planctomycetota bacterium]|nr:MAG: hypothetical protein DHS20C15_23490 [Planctomycetota bacterium]
MTSSRIPLLGLVGAAALCSWFAFSGSAVDGQVPARALQIETSRAAEAPRATSVGMSNTPRPLVEASPTLFAGELVAPQADQPVALGALQELTSKKIAKAEKALAKKETKLGALEGKLAARESAQADAESALTAAEANATQAALDLSAAEQQLADALELPQGTPEEISARKAAIKAANKAVSAAKKAQKVANKQAAKATKKLSKLAAKIAKLEDKVDDAEDAVADLEDTLAALGGDFDFQSTRVVGMDGAVTYGQGAPLAFAQITVVDKLKIPKKAKHLIENEITPAVYWQGFTDESGAFAAELRLPGHIDEVDLIVTKAGFRGSYTEEGLRELWGPFAPASRQTFEDDQLAELVIELQENL